MTKNKWTRDTNGDRYCAWHLAPVGADDPAASAVASVHPEWSATQTWGRGKPARWIVMDASGLKWGTTYPTVRAATKAVDHQRALADNNTGVL